MNILLIGSQHGNEPLGDKLYKHISDSYPELLRHITFIIGNPKAHKANIRYLDTDMNRSYSPTLKGYEAEQARKMLSTIDAGNFDLVLDLHTTVCRQPPCLIVRDIYPETRRFLAASSAEHIVLMQNDIVEHSLIGRVRHAVAIEMSNGDISCDSLDTLCRDLTRYIAAETHAIQKYSYKVELLLKTEVAPSAEKRLMNFEMSPDGFIPILVGENSYKKNTHYLGFKASIKTAITL